MTSRHALSALTLAILSVAATSASAQSSTQYQEPGFFYGGVSAGEARAKVDEPGVANSLLGANGPASGFSSDEKDTTYKLFGGYQFNRNIALEGGYFDLGKSSFSSSTAAGAFNNSTRRHGLNLDLVGTLPITERFSVLGRVGAAYGRTQSNFSGAGAAAAGVTTNKDNDTDVKVGLGVQYELNRSMWLRAEIERYRIKTASTGRTNVDTVTDWAVGDSIQLENAIFTRLTTTGVLASTRFAANANGHAMDANDHVVYNTTTGALSYDADGSGAGAAVQFATLVGIPTLSAADFTIT